MVSRKRLIEAGSAAYALATERRVQVVARLLLVAGLVFVLLRIRSIWHSSHLQLAGVEWSWAAGALAVSLCVAVASALIWVRILRRFAVSPSPALAGVFLQAQLGKYVPGAIWQYAGRGALAKAQGVPVRTVSRSLPIELLASLYAGAAFSFFLVGWWGAIGVVAAVASVGLLAGGVPPQGGLPRASPGGAAPLPGGAGAPLRAGFLGVARGVVRVAAGGNP